ncbi:MAG: low molecular weight phosphatase family protein [Candidatus Nanohaloarchaea archaeon]|nr:low molecular weight phosphatase family protein [Candidatus Nanohaloarchaea archaeon]
MKLVFLSRTDSGRSQIAHAFAHREAIKRRMTDLKLVTGGTDPDSQLQQPVIEALQETDIDLMGRRPRKIQQDDLDNADYVIGVGYTVEHVDSDAETRSWDIPSTKEKSVDTVQRISEQIEDRVVAFFDEIED